MAATKGAGNATVTYNSQNITAYVNSVDLQNTIAELEATNLASTGEESDAGLVNSVLRIGGDWSKALDDILGPDSLPGTKRTAVITFKDSGNNTVTWTWTSNAFITNYTINTAARDKITWSAQLRLSGLGVRS